MIPLSRVMTYFQRLHSIFHGIIFLCKKLVFYIYSIECDLIGYKPLQMFLMLQLTVIYLYLSLNLLMRNRIYSHLLSILAIHNLGMFPLVCHILKHQVIEFNM